MTRDDLQILAFTAGMASLATLVVLPPGIALAWLLSRGRWPGKTLVETLVSLPLVLPPVVTGLFLLKLFGHEGAVGRWLSETSGIEIAFTWKAVVIALAVMSLPLLVRTARTAFEEVDGHLEQQARTLGAGESHVFLSVTLPLARRGVMAGVLLAYTRALGEFGATLIVAGNLPGKWNTLPLEIHRLAELGKHDKAWFFAGISATVAFLAVATSCRLSRRRP